MSHVTHINESRHAYEWVMPLMNESCYTYEWAMASMNESRHTYDTDRCQMGGCLRRETLFEWDSLSLFPFFFCRWLWWLLSVRSHIWMNHHTHLNESWHTYERVMAHIRMSHVAHVDKSCHTYKWVMSHIWMSHVTHITYIGAQWRGLCNEICLCRWLWWHFSFMPHIWMSHVAHMNESCHTYEWVMSHIWMSHVTHMNESCHIYEWVMSHIWMTYLGA